MTGAGALCALLTPEIRARLGWGPDVDRPPDIAWTAARAQSERLAMSTGERAMVAIALGLWNGTRAGVDVGTLGQLDGANLRRLSRCLAAVADGEAALCAWARRELAR